MGSNPPPQEGEKITFLIAFLLTINEYEETPTDGNFTLKMLISILSRTTSSYSPGNKG